MKKAFHIIFRILTAFLFAYALYRVVEAYKILEFSYAAWFASAIIFLSFLFLSQKYETFLLLLFFGFSVYAGVSAFQIANEEKIVQKGILKPNERAKRLFLKAMRLKSNGAFKNNKDEFYDFCYSQDCEDFLKSQNQSDFWIFETNKSKESFVKDDKNHNLWYVDSHLNLFSKDHDGLKKMKLPFK